MYLVPPISGGDGMDALNLVERAYHRARLPSRARPRVQGRWDCA